MAEKIERWRSNDGTEFASEAEAVDRDGFEAFCAELYNHTSSAQDEKIRATSRDILTAVWYARAALVPLLSIPPSTEDIE